ncbi:TolC family protein [Desulfatibacillum aliphaticivorans]|uniref:TolC family protein n=1 Tax=Desulfatibacillum aliphaticivorans TaxID=218208 RepID=UPI000412BAF2|nr:TolC family protein [Desulfatibacillum aliphaticivorans]
MDNILKKIGLCMGVLLLGATSPGFAQETESQAPPPSKLGLIEVMELAASQSLNVLSATQDRDVAKGRIREAYANALPVINGGTELLYVSDSISRGENEQATASVSLNQPLFRAGSIAAGIRAAKLYEDYSEKSIESARLEAVRAACIRYYDVLLARADLQAVSETLDLSKYNLDVVTGRKAQGTATNLDVIRAREQMSNNQADLLSAKNALSIAKMRLFTVLRLSPDSLIAVEGELCFVKEPELEGAPLDIAMEHRPDLKVLKTQVAMQDENIIATRSDRLLSVDAVGKYSFVKPESPLYDDWTEEYYGGVVFTLPIFEGRRVSGRMIQEKAIRNQYQYAVDQKNDDIRLEVNEALDNLKAAAQVVKARETSVLQAQEALRLAQSGYEHGVNEQLDVLNAQVTFAESRLNYSRAVYNHNIYRIDLKRATGVLLKEINQTNENN